MPISFDVAGRLQKKYLFEEVLTIIADNFDPEDIFSENALEKWALDNGYILTTDCPEAE